MKRKLICTLAAAMTLLFLVNGCIPMHVYSQRVGNPDFSPLKTFYVIIEKDDTGGLNKVVAQELTNMGFQASTGTADKMPDTLDALVTYEYQWFWDMGTYLLMLKIFIRNPDTNFPYAMGESVRTSLARKSPALMAQEILTPIFNPSAVDGTQQNSQVSPEGKL